MISIVIPVYNVENMLNKCIDSILKQTYQNFELIAIDDGSSDNSLEVLQTYQNNSKIRIYFHENKGAAHTRNRGIELAKGKYIMFIDSDDFIDSDYLENYINVMDSGKYDICIGGYKRFIDGNVKSTFKLKDEEYSKYLITGPVCRMISVDFLRKENILFLDTNSSEDVYFNLCIYNKTNRIAIISDTGYYYVYNKNSLSNTVHKGFNQEIKILELLDAIKFDDGPNPEMNNYFIIKYCIWYLLYSGKNVTVDDFLFEYNKLFTWLDNNIPNYKENKYISLFIPKGEFLFHRLVIFVFMKFHNINKVKLIAKHYCRN